MKKTLFILLLIALITACNPNGGASKKVSKGIDEITTVNDDTEDDYIGDDENKSYDLGVITFTAEGQTYKIDKFGIDPYTVMTWFTPESDIAPMAGVVFKSADFSKTTMINFQDFDAMQTSFQGQRQIVNTQPIVSFVVGDTTYMFSEGDIALNNFSRKTGKVQLKVTGKCNKSVLTNPSALQQNVEATLDIDAFMPYASVDGKTIKTTAAEKFNIQ